MSDTREKLKQAALELFLERGYGGTTIAAIEIAAGLAPRAGGFYRHFESKEQLVLVIAREEIIEREDEFDFADIFPLDDTRAELLLIARVYLKANQRQKKYYAVIRELRSVPEIAAVEQSANDEMFSWLKNWISEKPCAVRMSDRALSSFVMTVFGGLLFYTTKKLQGVTLRNFSEKSFVEDWADYWTAELDR